MCGEHFRNHKRIENPGLYIEVRNITHPSVGLLMVFSPVSALGSHTSAVTSHFSIHTQTTKSQNPLENLTLQPFWIWVIQGPCFLYL